MSEKKHVTEKIVVENLIKNGFIIVLTFLFYGALNDALSGLAKDQVSDFLMTINILLVTVCFANFAFTYESVKIESVGKRMLAHSATFIFMLLIALFLEAMVISINKAYNSLTGISTIFSVLLYLGIALFDFWDLFRSTDK